MRSVLWIVGALVVLGSLVGCRRIAVSGDFEAPFEQEGLLMPQSTRSYTLTGPPGSKVTVDVGIDFEESERRADRMVLTVGAGPGARLGELLPGSQTRRVVCGVSLSDGGVPVDVKNLNRLRSAHFSLRVWKSPRLCQPRRVVPSTQLVRQTLPTTTGRL